MKRGASYSIDFLVFVWMEKNRISISFPNPFLLFPVDSGFNVCPTTGFSLKFIQVRLLIFDCWISVAWQVNRFVVQHSICIEQPASFKLFFSTVWPDLKFSSVQRSTKKCNIVKNNSNICVNHVVELGFVPMIFVRCFYFRCSVTWRSCKTSQNNSVPSVKNYFSITNYYCIMNQLNKLLLILFLIKLFVIRWAFHHVPF